MKRTTETEIVHVCLAGLKACGAFAWRNNTGARPWSTKPGEKRVVRFGTPGAPDIMAVFEGWFLAIECKRPGKAQTEDQKTWQTYCELSRGEYWVIESLDQLFAKVADFCTRKNIHNPVRAFGGRH